MIAVISVHRAMNKSKNCCCLTAFVAGVMWCFREIQVESLQLYLEQLSLKQTKANKWLQWKFYWPRDDDSTTTILPI